MQWERYSKSGSGHRIKREQIASSLKVFWSVGWSILLSGRMIFGVAGFFRRTDETLTAQP